jgi:hypothetical protein
MGYVKITKIEFEEKISPINKPFVLTIQFECLKALKDGTLYLSE